MRFNVIGHASSGIGLGVMACDLMRALSDLGHEVAGLDVDAGSNRKGRSHVADAWLRPAKRMFRDGIDVYVFPVFAMAEWKSKYHFGLWSVAYPLWEIEQVNPDWIKVLRTFDAVVSPGDFIGDVLERAGATVLRGKHPHYGADVATTLRERYGLPSGKTLYLFTFDPSSDPSRKNPQAVFEAFERAALDNAALCLQINRCADKSPLLDEWLKRLPGRVHVIERYLEHSDLLGLIAACDVYVSLHRAEGLGLGMMEAMQIGTPVIATGWSGNTSFMSADIARLVRSDLVRVKGTIPVYDERIIGKEAWWAEPDIDGAAAAMRELADPARRAALTFAACNSIEAYQTEARRLAWIDRLPAKMLPARPVPKKRLLIFTPTWPGGLYEECRKSVLAQNIAWEHEWVISDKNDYPLGDHRNVLAHYQHARSLALSGGYDALLTVEHDMVLPDLDAVQRLLDTDADLVYGVYVLRHGTLVLNAWRYENNRNLGMPLDNYPEELRAARKAGVWRVSGAGLGCTLVRRHVLERLDVHAGDGTQICPDLPLAEDALRAGFVSLARFDVLCDHLEPARRIKPFEVMETLRYTATETVRAFVGDRPMQLRSGQTVELTANDARDLMRVGYITPVEGA